MRKWSIVTLAVISVFNCAASADDLGELRAEMEQMRTMIRQQDKTIQKLESLRNGDDLARIQKAELAKMMKDIMDDAKLQPAMPNWMKDLTFSGDFRLRYQHDSRGWQNDLPGQDRHRKDRNRARFRLRFGLVKTWWDKQMEVGFRLASGSNSDSDSTNQTLTGAFSKKPVWIDLAYAKYQPKWAKGLTVMGGKLKNPIRTKTMVMWDSDINPEGFALDYVAPFFGDFKPYAQAGYWLLRDSDRNGDDRQGDTSRDVTMWNFGLGFDWAVAKDVKVSAGSTYYYFNHINAIAPDGGPDGQWLNSSGESDVDYGVLELTAGVEWKMFSLPFKAWGTWVHNCDDTYPNYNTNPDSDRHFKNSNDAFGIGLKVGKNKKKGDWSASYTYIYEEMCSVPTLPGGFGLGDSDFGGPNRKGHVIGGNYNLDDFLTLGGKVFITDPIHSDGANWSTNEGNTVTVQVDMVWKF